MDMKPLPVPWSLDYGVRSGEGLRVFWLLLLWGEALGGKNPGDPLKP